MANHIFFNQAGQYGSSLRQGLSSLEQSREQLNRVFATMNEMLEGDGTQDEHYALIQLRYSFETDQDARSAYNELNNSLALLNSNGNISNLDTALRQLFDRLR